MAILSKAPLDKSVGAKRHDGQFDFFMYRAAI